MAHGKRGRRPASELSAAELCAGRNAHGGKCGNPPAHGFPFCAYHLGPKDLKAQVSIGERLGKLTIRALDELERILDTGLDDAKLRAIKIIADRTIPTNKYIHVDLAAAANDGRPVTGTKLIEARMAELAARTHAAERENAQVTTDLIYDAELIIDADPESVVQQPISNPESAQADPAEPAKVRRQSTTATTREAQPSPDVVGLPYGVPRTTTQPADLGRIAGDRRTLALDDR